MLFFIAMQNSRQTIPGAAVVLPGIPVYYFIFSKNRKLKIANRK